MPRPNIERKRRPLAWAVLILAFAVILVATLLPAEPASPIEWDQVFCVLCGRACAG